MDEYRTLAAVVILRAVEDAVNIETTRGNRSRPTLQDTEDAREFLTRPSPDLLFWCRVAQIEMDGVLRYGRKLSKEGWRGERREVCEAEGQDPSSAE